MKALGERLGLRRAALNLAFIFIICGEVLAGLLTTGCTNNALKPPQATTPTLFTVGPSISSCGPAGSPGTLISTNTGSLMLLVTHDSPNTLSITDNGTNLPLSTNTSGSAPSGEYYTVPTTNLSPSTQVDGQFDTIIIQLQGGYTTGVQHSYAITEQNVSAPLVVNAIYDQSQNVSLAANNVGAIPPPPCTGSVPGPPQNLQATTSTLTPTGVMTDPFLQWSPVWWTQTGGNACSESDTYIVQISTDPHFTNGPNGTNGNYPQVSEIAQTIFNTPSSGQPNTGQAPLIPGNGSGGTATICQRPPNGSTTPQVASGSVPLQSHWGTLISPDYSQANLPLWGTNGSTATPPLFFRVRAGYYGNLGPWSQPASFTIPAPQQNVFKGSSAQGSPASQCPLPGGGTAECLAWFVVQSAVGYEVRAVVPDPGTPLPATLQKGELDFFVGTVGTPAPGSGGSGGDPNEPQCAEINANGVALWCGLSSSNSGGAFTSGSKIRWDVRAIYQPGQRGPWSQDFVSIW